MQEEANEATSLLPNRQEGSGNDAETEATDQQQAKEGDGSDVEQSKVGYCLYDYENQNDGEIELKSGDYVIVVQDTGEWLYVRCGDSYGYVAASYIRSSTKTIFLKRVMPLLLQIPLLWVHHTTKHINTTLPTPHKDNTIPLLLHPLPLLTILNGQKLRIFRFQSRWISCV